MPVKGDNVVDEALASLKQAVGELEAAREEIRAERAHAGAADVFARTLQEVLGDRALPEGVVRRAALIAAATAVWEDAVGPLLSGQQARELLGVSRQRLGQLVKGGRVLVLSERSGARRLPAWQFDPQGQPLQSLVDAHRQLVEAGGMSAWSAASWCVHAHPELGGRSPREWAAGGEDPSRLGLVAGRDAARFSQ